MTTKEGPLIAPSSHYFTRRHARERHACLQCRQRSPVRWCTSGPARILGSPTSTQRRERRSVVSPPRRATPLKQMRPRNARRKLRGGDTALELLVSQALLHCHASVDAGLMASLVLTAQVMYDQPRRPPRDRYSCRRLSSTAPTETTEAEMAAPLTVISKQAAAFEPGLECSRELRLLRSRRRRELSRSWTERDGMSKKIKSLRAKVDDVRKQRDDIMNAAATGQQLRLYHCVGVSSGRAVASVVRFFQLAISQEGISCYTCGLRQVPPLTASGSVTEAFQHFQVPSSGDLAREIGCCRSQRCPPPARPRE